MSPHSTAQPPPSLVAALELLERSVAYTRSTLQLVSAEVMHAPTPCSRWDLATMLVHMDDSLRALQEAADRGVVTLEATTIAPRPVDPRAVIASLKTRACDLLSSWTVNDGADLVSVAGCPLTAQILVSTGALEITVHGWDVAQACRADTPLPEALARDLLPLVPALVSEADRGRRFARPVPVQRSASAEDQLVAALGRPPRVPETRQAS